MKRSYKYMWITLAIGLITGLVTGLFSGWILHEKLVSPEAADKMAMQTAEIIKQTNNLSKRLDGLNKTNNKLEKAIQGQPLLDSNDVRKVLESCSVESPLWGDGKISCQRGNDGNSAK